MDVRGLVFCLLLGLLCFQASHQQNAADCSLMPEMGPCEAAMTRYYYDPSTGACNTFMYGGCQGNSNNFLTVDECLRACT